MAAGLTDRIATNGRRRGHLNTVAGLDELRELHAHRVEIEFAETPPAAALRAAAGVGSVEVRGNRVRCIVHGSFDALLASIEGHSVLQLTSHEPTLEELFLTYYREQSGRPPAKATAIGAEQAPQSEAGRV